MDPDQGSPEVTDLSGSGTFKSHLSWVFPVSYFCSKIFLPNQAKKYHVKYCCILFFTYISFTNIFIVGNIALKGLGSILSGSLVFENETRQLCSKTVAVESSNLSTVLTYFAVYIFLNLQNVKNILLFTV
jgi:hypothetical protein